MEFNRLRVFLGKYIPEFILNSDKPQVIIRAHILTGLYFASFVISVLLLLLFLLATAITDLDFSKGVMATGLAIVMLIFQFYVFYKMANVGTSAIIFSMAYFGITLAAVIISGGWHSPALPMFFCCPLISFLVGGNSEGLYMASITIFSGVCLMISHQLDFIVIQVIAKENIELLRLFIWICSIALLTSCLIVYEALLGNLMKN